MHATLISSTTLKLLAMNDYIVNVVAVLTVFVRVVVDMTCIVTATYVIFFCYVASSLSRL